MANWMLLFDDDPKKQGTLVNLDLVPTIRKNPDGSITISISNTMSVIVAAGQASDRCWEQIIKQTAGKKEVVHGA